MPIRKIWEWFFPPKPVDNRVMKQPSRDFLSANVAFYRGLAQADKREFERRVILFLDTTEVAGNGVEVTDEDLLLVAAGAIIPVWRFPHWHYVNLQQVILVPGAFNESSEYGQPDSCIQGMVGNGPMAGKMVLSKPALHHGFSNNKDKRNVAIHEFVHLIDMLDGECDGFPERLHDYAFSAPWLDLVEKNIRKIENRNSSIRQYGATNRQEFFAVATEYFFERPGLMAKKHPKIYEALQRFYQTDTQAILSDVKPRSKAPCPCGSGKRYKRCCMPLG